MELNVCPKCSSFVGRDWETCRSCGEKLPDLPPPPEPVAAEEPEPAEETPQPVVVPVAPADDVPLTEVGVPTASDDVPPTFVTPKSSAPQIAIIIAAVLIAVLALICACVFIVSVLGSTSNSSNQVMGPPSSYFLSPQ